MTTLLNMAPTISTTTPEASEAWWQVAWMEKAACAGEDPELWFSYDEQNELDALAVCRSCPVVDSCLEDAMEDEGGKRTAARFGVRGGLRPNERFNRYMQRAKAERRAAS